MNLPPIKPPGADGPQLDESAAAPPGDDNLVSLPVKPRELRPKSVGSIELIVDNKGQRCGHQPVIVHQNERLVTCKLCDAELDAFDALLRVALDHRHFALNHESATKEIRGAESRLKILERLESNARARVRKLGVKASKSHLDALVTYAREMNPDRVVTAESVERSIEFGGFRNTTPIELLRGAVAALEKGHPAAALELGTRAIDALGAAVGEGGLGE